MHRSKRNSSYIFNQEDLEKAVQHCKLVRCYNLYFYLQYTTGTRNVNIKIVNEKTYNSYSSTSK